jgi:hypothetical protein
MIRKTQYITIVLIALCIAGCSSGDPLQTVTQFSQALCSNDIAEANKHVVFEMRLDQNGQTEFQRYFASIISQIPGGKAAMQALYRNSRFEVIEKTPATARVNWNANMGQWLKDVASTGNYHLQIPESSLPGEYILMTYILEKRGGKWRIKEFAEPQTPPGS